MAVAPVLVRTASPGGHRSYGAVLTVNHQTVFALTLGGLLTGDVIRNTLNVAGRVVSDVILQSLPLALGQTGAAPAGR